MNIYHYDSVTKVYKTTTTAVSGHGIPANSTTVAVPTVTAGNQAVFNPNNNTWSLEPITSSPLPTQPAPTTFANMTLSERLSYYGLGDLETQLLGNAALAKKAVIDSQIAALQTILTNLQNDVTAMGTTNATVTANQQLIQELVEDFNRMNSTLLLEDNH